MFFTPQCSAATVDQVLLLLPAKELRPLARYLLMATGCPKTHPYSRHTPPEWWDDEAFGPYKQPSDLTEGPARALIAKIIGMAKSKDRPKAWSMSMLAAAYLGHLHAYVPHKCLRCNQCLYGCLQDLHATKAGLLYCLFQTLAAMVQRNMSTCALWEFPKILDARVVVAVRTM